MYIKNTEYIPHLYKTFLTTLSHFFIFHLLSFSLSIPSISFPIYLQPLFLSISFLFFHISWDQYLWHWIFFQCHSVSTPTPKNQLSFPIFLPKILTQTLNPKSSRSLIWPSLILKVFEWVDLAHHPIKIQIFLERCQKSIISSKTFSDCSLIYIQPQMSCRVILCSSELRKWGFKIFYIVKRHWITLNLTINTLKHWINTEF